MGNITHVLPMQVTSPAWEKVINKNEACFMDMSSSFHFDIQHFMSSIIIYDIHLDLPILSLLWQIPQ